MIKSGDTKVHELYKRWIKNVDKEKIAVGKGVDGKSMFAMNLNDYAMAKIQGEYFYTIKFLTCSRIAKIQDGDEKENSHSTWAGLETKFAFLCYQTYHEAQKNLPKNESGIL